MTAATLYTCLLCVVVMHRWYRLYSKVPDYATLWHAEVYGVNEMYTAIKAGHCVAGVAGLAELQLLIAGSGDCTLGLAGQFLSRSGGGFAAGSTACKVGPFLCACPIPSAGFSGAYYSK